MWGHISSLGQNVAQITKAVGAQILEAAADEERLDAADFSDGDTAECNTQEQSTVLVKKVQRLQDKLARARDEIDRLNDIRNRASESVSKSLRNKDEEITELRQLLDEARSFASESLSPRASSPESVVSAEQGSEAHVTAPVIHQKIKASERVSLLTRKLHEEKRSHIATLHQLKGDNSKLRDRVHSLESQLAARDSTASELDQQLSNQTGLISELQNQLSKHAEDLEAHKLVIARLRAESKQSPAREELERLQKTVTEQDLIIRNLGPDNRVDLEATISELRSELDRLKSEKCFPDESRETIAQLHSELDSERKELQIALKRVEDQRLQSESSAQEITTLLSRIGNLTSDLSTAEKTISELQTSSSQQTSSYGADLVPRQELLQLRDKARAQMRHLAQKCKNLEEENVQLRSNGASEKSQETSVNYALKENGASLQEFVTSLYQALHLDPSTFDLQGLKSMIISQNETLRSKPPIDQSNNSDLLSLLHEVLHLEEMTPAAALSKVRSLAEEAETASAHSKSITQAYEQAQDSLESLTVSKNQMKNEIDGLMKRISELQAQCRSAFAEEKSLLSQNSDLKNQIETLQNKISEVNARQGQNHSSSISRINGLEKEVQLLEKEIGNKDAVIRELTSQLENKTKRLVEVESVQDTWLEQAQRDRETLVAESERHRQDLLSSSAEYESRINALQEQIRKERDMSHQAQLDLQASQDLAADYMSLQMKLRAKAEECANLSDALDNLQVVLDQLQDERDSKLAEAEKRLQSSLEAAEEGRLAVQELVQVTRSLKESETTVLQLEAKLGSSRKYALQIESDNAALRHAMQQTMDRIKTFSSDENLVDRRIVNKLLVTYLERKASAEVLNLMIKMLGFTDDQRRLVLESQRPKGFISSLSSLIPTPYSAEDDDLDNESLDSNPQQQNLADLWVSFLLKETGTGTRRSSTASNPNEEYIPDASKSPSWKARSPIRSPPGPIIDAHAKSPDRKVLAISPSPNSPPKQSPSLTSNPAPEPRTTPSS